MKKNQPGPGRPRLLFGHEKFDDLTPSLNKARFFNRTWNCLRNAGIRTVKDILKTDTRDFLRIKNFGLQSLEDLDRGLTEIGSPHKGIKAYLKTVEPHNSWWRK